MNVKKSLRLRVFTLMMVTVMIASFLLTQTAAAFNVGGVTVNGTHSVLGATVTDVTGKVENDITDDLDPSAMNELPASVNGSDEISVIVKLNVPSISDVYMQKSTHYSIGEFAKTASADKVREDIEAAKAKVLKKLSRANIDYKLGYDYDMVITGFEVIVTANQFASLEKAIKGTATAIVSEVYEECKVTESSVGGAQLVENEVNVYETGIFNSSNSKYDGSGTTIAVLDTGYDYTHTAYSVENFTSTNLAMTKESVAAVLSATKAYGFTEGLTADDVYMNAKIPYAYDYADKDADVYPIQSEHGTHVASIISGKNDVITGVAPNAQLVLMKVFSDLEQGAKTSWILAALQDCVALEVDVINMSLGTSSGFTRQSDKAEVEAVYDKLHEIGVSVVAAASNDYNSTMGSAKNGNLGLTSNPDSATVGSPSTYEGSLSVASISGVKTPYLLDKDGNIIYFVEANDASAEPKHFVDEILNANETERVFEYVTIPGVGRSADYTGLDVVGKIALVRRGSNTFEEKAQIAQRKGAAGVVIYNNVSGDISMTIGRAKVPVVSITQDNGEKLAAHASGTLTVSRAQVAGPFMSDFSSWGPAPDLSIKPEITAHGGDIYAAVPGEGYDRLSGTSMAAPNQAGVTALVRQYVKENFPEIAHDNVAVSAMTYQLMMSTTDIAYNKNGLPFFVRKQGSGLANLEETTSTPAYILTYNEDGSVMDKTKLELGDDVKKTGKYTFTFGIRNIGKSSLTYDVGAIVMTEGVSETKTHQGDTTVDMQGVQLNAGIKVESVASGTNSGNTVTVAAGATAQVTATITLTDEDKKYLDESFANGMYVEGFVTLDAVSGTEIDLNVCYLTFYGDWTQAPLFDIDYFETDKDELDDSIDAADKTQPDTYASRPVGGMYEDYISYLGSYHFKQSPSSTKIAADRKYISLTNQGRGVNSLHSIYAGMIRNAKRVEITITNAVTGEVVFRSTELNQLKSRHYGSNILASSIDVGFSVAQNNLENNTQYLVKVQGFLDYGDGGEYTNKNNTFEFPFVTDFQAPTLEGVEFYTEYDKNTEKTKLFARMSVYDNHYSMGFQVGRVHEGLTAEGEKGLMLETFGQYVTPIYSEFGATSVVTYELTDYIDQIKGAYNTNSFIVATYDYAMNEAIYEVRLPDGIKSVCFEEEEVTLSPNETHVLKPLLYPDDTWAAMLEYESDNEDVVRVVNGKLLAVATGEATVTARSTVYDASTTLKVKVLGPDDPGYKRYDKPVADVFGITGYKCEKVFFMVNSSDRDLGVEGATSIQDVTSLKMFPSEAVTLLYTLNAYYDKDVKVKFESSDDEIVGVDENGKITALAEGNANVTVTVEMDGESTFYSQTIYITVKTPYTSASGYLQSYRGMGGTVDIGADLKGMLITHIDQYAFSGYKYIPKDLENGDVINDEDPYNSKITYIGENTIKKVIIPEGVEEIGVFAFAGLTALEEVVFPSTLKKIQQSAFLGCTKLKKVSGLENVQFLNQSVFEGCAINTVDLDSVVAIGNKTFKDCKLVTVDLPETAQSIGIEAFAGNANLSAVTIRAAKVKLGSGVFEGCGKLSSISINAAVIPASAFEGCAKLSNVTLGKDVSVIGANAFRGTAVSSFNLSSENQAFSVAEGGKLLLSKDGKTLALVAPGYGTTLTNNTVEAVGDSAFSGNNTLTLVNLPNVTEIGAFAFYHCSKLSNISVGSLTAVGDYAFYGTALKNAPDLSGVSVIGNYAFANSMIKSLNIGSSEPFEGGAYRTVIGEGAFRDCALLAEVTVGNGVKIGNYAFAVNHDEQYMFASTLQTLRIGSSVAIGDDAFYGAQSLYSLTLGTDVQIGSRAFFNTVSLKKADLSGVTAIGDYAFSGLVLSSYNSYGQVVGYVFRASGITEANLSNVAQLGEGAFMYCTNLERVVLNDSLTDIPDFTFGYCLALSDISLGKVLTVGEAAFAYTALSEVDLSSATAIGNSAFAAVGSEEDANSVSLTSVTLNANGVTVGDGAFSGNLALSEVENMGKVTYFGVNAFGLTAVEVANLTSATFVGDYAFADSAVTEVIFGESLTSVGDNPFVGCALDAFTKEITQTTNGYTYVTEEDTFVISESVKVEGGALYSKVPTGWELVSYPINKSDLSYTVAEGTVRIASYAFAGVQALSGVELPLSLDAIGHMAFYGCDSLNVVVFKSLAAPALEERYDESYLLYTNIPYAGPIAGTEFEGLGIVDYYMWNITSSFSSFYFGANFVDYIGHYVPELVMVRPENGTNYDSFILDQYFNVQVEGTFAPDTQTLKAIELIAALPGYITLADEDAILAARAAYDLVTSKVQQSLIADYGKLTAAERTLAYLKSQGNDEPTEPSDPVDPSDPSGPVDPVDPEPKQDNTLTVLFAILAAAFAVAATAFAVMYFNGKKTQR